MADTPHTLFIEADDTPGVLSRVAAVFASRGANITGIQMLTSPEGRAMMTIEAEGDTDPARLVEELLALTAVHRVTREPSLMTVYGKRVIIIGGGAQVGQVAVGAISEADRHNIRGERISIDTIPLVGEQELAAAVRAVMRLPRVQMLVLAGSLMGGDITKAVEEVRANGVRVISLNMAGSVPDAADLVVTDPVQAGVMAVMAVADTAKFDLMRQLKRRY